MPHPSVEDELAIHGLYARYSWALDTGDTDGYVALFTEDAEATEETSSGELEVRKGREEIRKLVLKFHERPDFPGHQHQMAQFVFDPDPQGRPRPSPMWSPRCRPTPAGRRRSRAPPRRRR